MASVSARSGPCSVDRTPAGGRMGVACPVERTPGTVPSDKRAVPRRPHRRLPENDVRESQILVSLPISMLAATSQFPVLLNTYT